MVVGGASRLALVALAAVVAASGACGEGRVVGTTLDEGLDAVPVDDGMPDAETTSDSFDAAEDADSRPDLPEGDAAVDTMDALPDGEADDGTPDVPADEITPDLPPIDDVTEISDTGRDLADVEAEVPSTRPGDSCASGLVVDPDALPWSDSGNTNDYTDQHDGAVCDLGAGEVSFGLGAPDVAYAFTPNVAGIYTVTVSTSSFLFATFRRGCTADDDGVCMGSGLMLLGPIEIEVALEAGETYAIVIDGTAEGASGSYTLTVSQPCIPECEGRQCGQEPTCGTEEVCGTCADGEACEAGTYQCIDVSGQEGDTCLNAFVIGGGALPFETTADSSDAHDTLLWADGQCGEEPSALGGLQAPDEIWRLDVDEAGTYLITAASDWDASLYVTTDCADMDAGCIAGAGAKGGGLSEELVLDLVPGSYFIVVDGTLEGSGEYTLSVSAPCAPSCDGKICGDDGCGGSCGGCAMDEACDISGQCIATSSSCEAVPVLTTIPNTIQGDSGDQDNELQAEMGVCPGYPGSLGTQAGEEVWAFVPPATAVYRIAVEDDGTWPVNLYVVTDCDDIGGTCLAGAADPAVLDATFEGGTTHYVVVDGGIFGGPYEMTISEPCVPACQGAVCGGDGCGGVCGECPAGETCDAGACVAQGGDTCEAAFTIDAGALPFEGSGDNSDASDQLEMPNVSCPGVAMSGTMGILGTEEFWAFTPEATGTYAISLPSAAFNPEVYVLTDCGDPEGSCAGADDTAPTDFSVEMTAGVTYTIVIDFFAFGAGPYTLAVDGPL